ncbi:glycine/betaine ABC transporter substrate-binding protein [bacterium]|nr:glycine/betaine ABC transporter substrate-binding protein [bacterium]
MDRKIHTMGYIIMTRHSNWITKISLFLFVCLTLGFTGCTSGPKVVIGCKNFTEQYILSEIMALLLEEETDLLIERTWSLGGTMICHQALTNGEIDLYPEYTGTAYISILKHDDIQSATKTLQIVNQEYAEQFNCAWLKPLGFNNTYAITVREAMAKDKQWQTISDLVQESQNLTAGFTVEFHERPDGYPGLQETYNLAFQQIIDLDPGLMYKAVNNKQVDVICAFSTDGRIPAYNLHILKDDKQFFPPYYAAPVVRKDTLKQFPEIKTTLNKLAGILDNKTMQKMNYEADEMGRPTRAIAKEFLQKKNLLPK